MATPIDPQSRARPGARGTPVEIDGHAWLFADYVPTFAPVWDRLYDLNLLAGRYDQESVFMAAVRLLYANYDLSPDEAADVVLGADSDEIVAAVEAALFGPKEVHRTYSQWVASALWSNGIDPARVPPEHLRPVLEQLVATHRAVALGDFVSAAEAARVRADMLSFATPRAADE